jgi:hypothetical protein
MFVVEAVIVCDSSPNCPWSKFITTELLEMLMLIEPSAKTNSLTKLANITEKVPTKKQILPLHIRILLLYTQAL